MILDIFEFIRQGREASGKVPVSVLERLDVVDRGGELAWHAESGRAERDYPMLKLDVTGPLSLMCQRCLEPMPYDVDVHARFKIVRSEEEAEAEPLDDDAEDPVVGSTQFNLLGLIEDEVLLSLPAVPRHERCPATASRPGGAAAVPGARPSPFAVLSSLKTGRGEPAEDGSAQGGSEVAPKDSQ